MRHDGSTRLRRAGAACLSTAALLGGLVLTTTTASPAHAALGATLGQGAALMPGDLVEGAPGVDLVMQHDGNLVEYVFGKVTFATMTFVPGSYLLMQADGNLVVYTPNGVPVWQAGTAGQPAVLLVLSWNGTLTLVSSDGRVVWDRARGLFPPVLPGDVVRTGGSLPADVPIMSPNGRYRALMQHDGNFVEYMATGQVVFNTGTRSAPTGADNHLTLQWDGNLVVSSIFGQPLWSSQSSGTPEPTLRIQDDGNLVIRISSGTPIWSSLTGRIAAST